MRLSVLLLLLTLLPILCTFFPLPTPPASAPPLPPEETEEPALVPLLEAEFAMRGLWIATVDNIDFPSRAGLSAAELRNELCTIVDFAAAEGFNALFFQVRPAADALYPSEHFPASRYLACTDDSFDCLGELLTLCHARGMALYAWVNPLRVRTGDAPLAETSPAALHPDWVMTYAGREFFNPGLPEVRALVADGVREIAEHYAVDGIVFDDYFYPYPVSGETPEDSAAFAAYGGGRSLADFRRESVNALIEAAHDAVKEANPRVRFGVSPFGIYKNSEKVHGLSAYDEIYCDALAWAAGGYVDFLAPQLYWAFDNAAAPFASLCDFWNHALADSDTDLYIGLGVYRYAENVFSPGELSRQIDYVHASAARGTVCYGLSALQKNAGGVGDEIRACFFGEK